MAAGVRAATVTVVFALGTMLVPGAAGAAPGGGVGGGSAVSAARGAVVAGVPRDADPLAMVAPGSNPAIPAEGLPAGKAVILLDGVDQSPTVVRRQMWGLIVSGTGLREMELFGFRPTTSPGALGKQLRPTASGVLTLMPRGQVNVFVKEGTYRAGSTVRIYLSGVAEPFDQQVDADGGLWGEPVHELPATVERGPHLLQVNGFAPDGRVLSTSLGIMVATAQTTAPELRWPDRIRDAGTTRLARLPITTDAGREVEVSVECHHNGEQLPRSVCHRVTLPGGWVGVWLSGRRATSVYVVAIAPAAEGYIRLFKPIIYKTRKVR